MRFTEFHAGGGTDAASRTALMTGEACSDGFSSGSQTLAEQLKRAGYNTGLIGYWGLGAFDSPNAPHRRGFDEVVTYGDRRHAHDLYTGHLYRKDPLTGYEDATVLAGNRSGQKEQYLPDLLTRAALKFCKQNKPERLNQFTPFFLVVSYPVPAAVSAGGGEVPPGAAYADKSWSTSQKARGNAITRLDQHVGQIVDELEKRAMARNTIVLVTSSLGPRMLSSDAQFFKSTGRFGSGDLPLSEGRLRVPLIVRWPFWIREGSTSDLLLSGADLAPTLLEAARTEVPDGIDGISFLPTITRQAQTNRHDYLVWSSINQKGDSALALRVDDWKLIRNDSNQPWRLYDLAVDPGEQTDVATAHPDVLRKLEALLVAEEGPAESGSSSDSGG